MDPKQLNEHLNNVYTLGKQATKKLQEIFGGGNPGGRRKEILVGSTCEGCFFPRYFHPDHNKHELELDKMHKIMEITEREYELIQPIEGKPDFVRIFNNQSHLELRGTLREDGRGGFDYDIFLNPTKIKEKSATTLADEFNFQRLEGFYLLELATRPKRIAEEKRVKGTAITTKVALYTTDNGDDRKDKISQASIDNVPAIFCSFLPLHAQAFTTRGCAVGDAWPSQSERQQMVLQLGCEIVPKSSRGGNPNQEWRWSFTQIECEIMRRLSREQKLCYNLVKILFNKHIKPINDEKVHTYWLKTVMLWTCEEYHPANYIWRPENRLIFVAILFRKMYDMCDMEFIPHFVTPEVNLLDNIDGATLCNMALKMDAIANDPQSALPSHNEFRDVIKELHTQHDLVYKMRLVWRGKLAEDEDILEMVLNQCLYLMTPESFEVFFKILFQRFDKITPRACQHKLHKLINKCAKKGGKVHDRLLGDVVPYGNAFLSPIVRKLIDVADDHIVVYHEVLAKAFATVLKVDKAAGEKLELICLAFKEFKRCDKEHNCKAFEQLVGSVMDVVLAKMPDALQDPNNRNETPVVFRLLKYIIMLKS